MKPPVKTPADLVRALQLAQGQPGDYHWGRGVFLIGAGCSVSSGIPLAISIAEKCVLDIVKRFSNDKFHPSSPDEAFTWLRSKGELISENWREVYNEVFKRHYQEPAMSREVIVQAVGRVTGVNDTHRILGMLLKERYAGAIMTTNFDNLLMRGMFDAGLYEFCHVKNINDINLLNEESKRPRVAHLHGTTDSYYVRNTEEELEEVARQARYAIHGLLQESRCFVVVGYSGIEPGIMNILVESAGLLPGKTIYWILYESSVDALSDLARKLLATSANSGVILGQDSDHIFNYISSRLDFSFHPQVHRDQNALISPRVKRASNSSKYNRLLINNYISNNQSQDREPLRRAHIENKHK